MHSKKLKIALILGLVGYGYSDLTLAQEQLREAVGVDLSEEKLVDATKYEFAFKLNVKPHADVDLYVRLDNSCKYNRLVKVEFKSALSQDWFELQRRNWDDYFYTSGFLAYTRVNVPIMLFDAVKLQFENPLFCKVYLKNARGKGHEKWKYEGSLEIAKAANDVASKPMLYDFLFKEGKSIAEMYIESSKACNLKIPALHVIDNDEYINISENLERYAPQVFRVDDVSTVAKNTVSGLNLLLVAKMPCKLYFFTKSF